MATDPIPTPPSADAETEQELAQVPVADLARLRQFFAVLSDEARLALCGVLVLAPEGLSATDLAARTGQRPADTVKHLAQLQQAGIVRLVDATDGSGGGGGTRTYVLDSVALRAERRRMLTRARAASPADVEGTPAWEQQVLRAFFDGQRLREIPVTTKKRMVVLVWLVGRFQYDERYPERQVNALLGEHHPDFATLRRELVDRGLLAREAGIYWRVDEAAAEVTG